MGSKNESALTGTNRLVKDRSRTSGSILQRCLTKLALVKVTLTLTLTIDLLTRKVDRLMPPKGVFIATQLNSTQLDVELSTRSQREQLSPINERSDPVDSVCRS